ncbi:MAG: response regulator transcription factor [Taibaiella sp.]|nr:response regulator transcription factor [Taibaiella sp.]
MDKLRVALVEDQRLFRDGMAALINETGDMEVVSVADNGRHFLDLLPDMKELPQVALIDMNMPEMNGLELAGTLVKTYPEIRVIVLTVHNQERFIVKMIEAGVAGYLVKNCDIDEVRQAIRTAHKTGFYFNEATMLAMRNGYKMKNLQVKSFANIPVELTEREVEVLCLICQEFTNIEIGERLNISPRTVDGHRNNLLAKAGCKNTAGLVLFAVNNNIYDPLIH